MTTTNAELIAEARRQAKRYDKYLHSMSTWGRSTEHGKDTRMKAELLDLLATALESATTVTDEMVDRAGKAIYERVYRTAIAGGMAPGWEAEHIPHDRDDLRESARAALTAALTEGERR